MVIPSLKKMFTILELNISISSLEMEIRNQNFVDNSLHYLHIRKTGHHFTLSRTAAKYYANLRRSNLLPSSLWLLKLRNNTIPFG